jgi:type II secretory pathway pseudopilin PulG
VVAARSEAGDTLVEILIALAVISLTAVAILAAFTTAIASSSEHRDLATLDAVLKSYVESVSYQLGRQSPTAFVPCATVPGPTYSSLTTTQGNYNVSLTGIEFWQSNNTWATACNASAQPPQAELLTATAVNSTKAGDSESLQFSVSDPNYSPASPGPPVFTGSLRDSVTAGVASTFAVFASGWPTPALSASGEPSWVTFVDEGGGNGSIFMQPPANASGSYSFALTATNSYNGGTTVSKTFTIQVAQAPAITSASTDTVSTGTPLSFTVAATGIPTPALSASGLPGWATFTDNHNGTGTITGTTPGSGETDTISLGALNSAGSASQTFTLTVSAQSRPTISTPSGTSPACAKQNTSFNFNVSGTQFQNHLTITSSGLASIVVVYHNSTSLTVAATSGSSGSYFFTIENPDGGQVTSANNAIQVSTGNGNSSC